MDFGHGPCFYRAFHFSLTPEHHFWWHLSLFQPIESFDTETVPEMTEIDLKTLKPATIAYGEIQRWLVNGRVASCGQNSQGTWVAQLTRDRGYKCWIVWNPDKTIPFEIPIEWNVKQVKEFTGKRTNMVGINHLNIGIAPVLLENVQIPADIRPPLNLRISSQ